MLWLCKLQLSPVYSAIEIRRHCGDWFWCIFTNRPLVTLLHSYKRTHSSDSRPSVLFWCIFPNRPLAHTFEREPSDTVEFGNWFWRIFPNRQLVTLLRAYKRKHSSQNRLARCRRLLINAGWSCSPERPVTDAACPKRGMVPIDKN